MICIVCGGEDYKVITDRLRFDIPRRVVQCIGCDLISLEDPTVEVMNYATEYDRRHGPVIGRESTPEELFETYSPYQPPRLRRVEQLLGKDKAVLEVGCSTGYFLHALDGRVGTRVGLELNPRRAAHARERCGIEVHECTLEEAPLTRQFDVIFAFQVFEHLPRPLDFLARSAELLRPGGKLYLEVPNIEEALVQLYQNAGYQAFNYRAPHVYYYSKATLQRLMAVAGFAGAVSFFQECSLFNHLHWIDAGAPQSDFAAACEVPAWEAPPVLNDVAGQLRTWLEDANSRYKHLLEGWGLSDNLSFAGGPAGQPITVPEAQ